MRSLVVLAALIGTTAACAPRSPRPYVTTSSKAVVEALKDEQTRPKPTVISICYSKVLNSSEQVLEEARFECADGQVTLREQDVLWTPCGLLQPRRATFLCTPARAPGEGAAE